MAIRDQEGDSGGDWWAQQAPPPTDLIGGPEARAVSSIQGWYQQYFGRAATLDEVNAHLGNPGGLPAVEALIKAAAQRPADPDPSGDGDGGGGGGGNGGGGAPAPAPIGVPTTGFGAAPTPYASDPNAPTYDPMPTYVPPMWTGGDYQNPTEAELYASPGYQSRLNAGLMGRARSAAAQGTILNGGTQKALERYGQDYANNEYQTLRNNTFEAYKQRYSQFQDAAGMDLNARTINANESQNTFQNRTNTYTANNSRTLGEYLQNYTTKRNSELDYWSRLQDLNQTGAGLAGGSR